MWAVMVVVPWDSLEVHQGRDVILPLKTSGITADQPQWFIPVFASEEAALLWSGGLHEVRALALPPQQEHTCPETLEQEIERKR